MVKDLAPARRPDWEARLSALIKARREQPFKWGEADCALWGADVVAAQTGADFGEPFRGKYENAEGAALALREWGAGTLTRTFDRHLHRTLPSLAKRGDLVKARKSPVSPQGAIGVVIGGDALFVGEQGLERLPRANWSLAWSV